jgi:hypothetical protein
MSHLHGCDCKTRSQYCRYLSPKIRKNNPIIMKIRALIVLHTTEPLQCLNLVTTSNGLDLAAVGTFQAMGIPATGQPPVAPALPTRPDSTPTTARM